MQKLKEKYYSLSPKVIATFWFLVCSVLQRGISTITTPIFSRLLTTAEYGQYGAFNSWLSIIQIIVTLDLTAGVYTMGIVKFKEEEAVFTSSLQGLNLVLCITWAFIYLVLHSFWNNLFSLTTVQMIAMFIMVWSTAAFTFWMTTQRNQFKYRKLVIVTLIVSILKPVVGIAFVLHAKDKVTARILGLALVEVVCYTGFFVSQMRKGKVFFSRKYWEYAVLFNLPLLPHYLGGTVLSGADRIMIKNMVSDSAAGIYTLAYSISLMMNMVKDSLNKTISPYLYQRIREKDYMSMPKVIYPALIVIAGANLVLISFAPEIMTIFAPKEYMEAIYIVPPVAMSVYVQFLYLCFAPFEFYFEKRTWTTIGTLISAGLNLFLNYIFIQLFSYRAAGYTTLVCYSINSLMHYHFMRKVCKEYLNNIKPYSPKMLLGITSVFFVFGFAYIPLYTLPVVRYVLTALIMALIFFNRGKLIPVIKKMIKIRQS